MCIGKHVAVLGDETDLVAFLDREIQILEKAFLAQPFHFEYVRAELALEFEIDVRVLSRRRLDVRDFQLFQFLLAAGGGLGALGVRREAGDELAQLLGARFRLLVRLFLLAFVFGLMRCGNDLDKMK